jgi:hypothetical protein
MLGDLKMAAGMGNFRLVLIPPQPGNLASLTRLNECLGDLSSNESRSFRDWRFWGLILWNSLWGEFISIPKEVIGMATTCEEKSRAVPKVIRSGV